MIRINLFLIVLFSVLFSASSLNAQINMSKLKSKAKSFQKEKIVDKPHNNTKEAHVESAEKPTTTTFDDIIHVDINRGKNKNSGTVDAPMKNIDKALSAAMPGQEIKVAGGTYMGTFNIGYLETDKPIRLRGSFDPTFTNQDIENHPTVFQPDNASAGSSRKPLLQFTNEIDGSLIEGFVWDMGERNLYSPKEGLLEGIEGGRMLKSTEQITGFNSTVEEAHIKILSKTKGGDLTVRNCVFVNGASYAILGGNRSGNYKILNNVFVANRMAALEIFGTCAGSNQQRDMVACGNVEIAYNTILFTWSRLKDLMDMGYGIRFMTKLTYDVHHNIVGTTIKGGLDNSRFCRDDFIKVYDNIFFGNKDGDLYYTPASNTKLNLRVDQFEDLEFERVDNNLDQLPSEMSIYQPYLKGFYNVQYSETTNYDPNSPENYWARALGMNQSGTMQSNVTMHMNKYPWRETLKLFGVIEGYGAQKLTLYQ